MICVRQRLPRLCISMPDKVGTEKVAKDRRRRCAHDDINVAHDVMSRQREKKTVNGLRNQYQHDHQQAFINRMNTLEVEMEPLMGRK